MIQRLHILQKLTLPAYPTRFNYKIKLNFHHREKYVYHKRSFPRFSQTYLFYRGRYLPTMKGRGKENRLIWEKLESVPLSTLNNSSKILQNGASIGTGYDMN